MLRPFIVIGILTTFSLGWSCPLLGSGPGAATVGPLPTIPPCRPEAQKSPIIVLSIDGAAVRGVAQFELLLAIEDEVNKALVKAAHTDAHAQTGVKGRKVFPYQREGIADIFDFFAGTSAGSVNVGGLLIPNDVALADTPGHASLARPKFTLSGLKAKLPDTLKAAFSSSPVRDMRTLQIPGAGGGLLGSKFTAKPFEQLLQEMAGSARMSDLIKPAIITSYDLRAGEVINFSTHEACAINQARDKNVFLWQAIRASSAAPVFYKPLEIEIGGKQRALIDAGLFVMSPTLLAWSEAQKLYPGRSLIIVSISSGSSRKERKVKTQGLIAGGIPMVLKPTIETAFEGQQALTDSIMRDLPGVQYFRLSFDIINEEFGNMSEENIKMLEEAARKTIASDEFRRVIAAISKARLERKEKQDLPPYFCQARDQEKGNQKLTGAKVATETPHSAKQTIKGKVQNAYRSLKGRLQDR